MFRRQDRADKVRLRRGVNFIKMTSPGAALRGNRIKLLLAAFSVMTPPLAKDATRLVSVMRANGVSCCGALKHLLEFLLDRNIASTVCIIHLLSIFVCEASMRRIADTRW
jgi:hypothetical protein